MLIRFTTIFVLAIQPVAANAKPQPLIWCVDHVPQRQHYEKGKAPYGPMVDLMQDLAGRLQLELEFTLPTPVNRCLQQLEQGEVDIVASLLYSAERAKSFYLMPFDIAHSERWFIHRENKLQERSGLRITLINNFIYSPSLAETYAKDGHKVTTADNIEQALTQLYFRDTDVVVGPEHFTLGYIERNARYKNALRLAPVEQQRDVEAHIAISKTGRYAGRYDEFNHAIQMIRQEGKYRLYIE